ncbi:hypothetical protein WA171_000721, partial [Blastocystis sp. BT1]
MRFFVIVTLIVVIQGVYAKCFSLSDQCIPSISSSTKQVGQFNNQTVFYSPYFDLREIYYSDNQCNDIVYEVLTHSVYNEQSYCYSSVESVWVRIPDTSNAERKAIVDNCGSALRKKFVDISTLSCTVNGQDPFLVERALIGSHQHRCIRFDDSGTPSTFTMAVSGSCSNSNNVGRSWIVPMVITCTVVIVVIVIVVIVVIVYVFASPCKKQLKMKDTKD